MTREASDWRRFASDTSGMTLVEFGFVAPVFLLMIIGLMDLGQLVYARALLQGAVEEAARSSALETGDIDVADEEIAEILQPVAPGATIEVTRKSYFDFADIGRAEALDDKNGDGLCGTGENYTDENGNDQWDDDIGIDGNGGAGDVVMYNVTVTFERIFKVGIFKGDDNYVINASAVKKNQPFADQATYSSTAKSC